MCLLLVVVFSYNYYDSLQGGLNLVSQGHMLADVVAIIGKFSLSHNFGITPKIPLHVLLEIDKSESLRSRRNTVAILKANTD